MWPSLYLPKGEPKFEKLNYWTTDLTKLLLDLQAGNFSGYVEILSPHQHGLFLFHQGHLHNCFYDGTEELQLTHSQILEHFLKKNKSGPQTVINVAAVPPEAVTALSALDYRQPLYRELESGFLDMTKLFETLGAKHFTGYLRFYRIRSHTRLGNILVKMNKITRDQLQNAVRLQLAQKGVRLGDALVQSGAINAGDLDSALDLQSHARKGSDVEIALALFFDGRFSGGYSYTHKNFNLSRDEILPQMAGTEVLLDITEGGLPEEIEIPLELSAAPEVSKPAGRMSPLAAPPPWHETMTLRGDELILDLSRSAAASPSPVPEAEETPAVEPPPAPDIPKAEVVLPLPALSTPEPELQTSALEAAAPAPMPIIPKEEIPAELQGVDYIAAVLDLFMGRLGNKLLEREQKALGAGQELSSGQLQELGQRLEKVSSLIMGVRRSRLLAAKINERLV